MNYLKDLLKRTFDIWCMKRWQKTIDKEMDLCNRYQNKANHYRNVAYHHRRITEKLYAEYCEIYPKNEVSANEET